MIIGLTGSIAMGKSEVAKTLRAMNIPVFDADAAVHEIYENGVAAKALADLCPEAIIGYKVDRKILSAHVAKSPELLNLITAIIHPLVQKAEQQFIADHQAKDIIVIDSPLILEAGRKQDMDLLIVVSSSPEKQKSRALKRPGMTEEKFNFILSKQLPDSEKRTWADYVIENNGSLEDLSTITKTLINEIRSKQHA